MTLGLPAGCIPALAAGRPELGGRAYIRVNGLRQIEDLVREIEQFPVLLILLLHRLPLLVGDDLPLGVGRFWLIRTNVDKKIASRDTIIVNSPNG